jgi:hypothetical protein
MKMPALLKQSGLVQSLAFMRSREEEEKFCDELATTYGLLATNDKSAGEVLQDQAQNAELPVSIWFCLGISSTSASGSVALRRASLRTTTSYQEEPMLARRKSLHHVKVQTCTHAGLWLDKFLKDQTEDGTNDEQTQKGEG